MSTSRNISKLGTVVNSNGQVPSSAIAAGAAGVLAWLALTNSAGTQTWVKLCTINGSQNDRGSILLSGSYGYSAADDMTAGGATIHYTVGNDSSPNNLNLHVLNSGTNPFILAAYAVRVGSDYIWDVWVQANVYERINCVAYGTLYTITSTYTDVMQTTKPTGGYDKKVGRAVTSLTPGAVLQVVSVFKGDTWSTTSTTPVEIPGLSIAITPSSTTSKILVIATGSAGTSAAVSGSIILKRDSSYIGWGNATAGYNQTSGPSFYGGSADGNNNEAYAINYLDSPATMSTITYKLAGVMYQSGTLVVNGLGSDIINQVYSQKTASSITLMEIAG